MMIHEPTARTVKCTPMGATFPPTGNRRQDFGRVEVQITIDDPQNDSRPFTIKFNLRVLPDTDVLEKVCAENEKDLRHLAIQ